MSFLIPAKERAKTYAESQAKELKNSRYSYINGESKKCFITYQRLVSEIWLSPRDFLDLFTDTPWSFMELKKLHSDFVRVISILVEIRWPNLDSDFKHLFFETPDRSDKNLPFANDDLGFLNWESQRSFQITQHAYTPFVIGKGGREVEIQDEKVMPFEGDPELVGEGCFGEVFKAKIPSGCYVELDLRNQERHYQESYCLAFKRLYRKADYKREVENLGHFSNSLKSHRNIAHCIQAVSQGNLFRIFFPFADHGSLEDLFKKPIPAGLSVTSQTLMHSLHHLIDGVAFIHDEMFIHQKDSGSYKYGAHLDLKPANVLVYPNPRDEQGAGVWTITDFGISSFKDVDDQILFEGPYGPGTVPSGDSSTQIPGLTGPRDRLGAYCAPELHPLTNVPFRGCLVDMWSVGVMFVDVLCFALDGGSCIERFRNARLLDNDRNDYFFEVSTADQSVKFAVRSVVAVFLEDLVKQFLEERRWVRDCILIVCDILRIEPNLRLSARAICQRLIKIDFHESGDDLLEPWDKERLGAKWDTTPPINIEAYPVDV